jgi:hypothetical protein
VWVDLAAAFGVQQPASWVGYRLVGEVRGELVEWLKTSAGWMGLVNVVVTSPSMVSLRQLVPESALRPRDDGRTLAGTLDRRRDRH